MYIYKGGAHYTLIEGYPKPLREELGIVGPVDAAYVCPNQTLLYVVKGDCSNHTLQQRSFFFCVKKKSTFNKELRTIVYVSLFLNANVLAKLPLTHVFLNRSDVV